MNKNQKGFGFVEVLVVIIVIGLMAAIGWLVYNRQQPSETRKPAENTAEKPAALQPEDITNKIKSNYAAKFKLLNVNENNQPKQGEMSVGLLKFAPTYKTEGYDFYTDYDGGSTISLMAGPVNWAADPIPREVDTQIRTEIANVFREFGLAKTGITGSRANGTEPEVYTGKGLICTIEPPGATTSSTAASCGRVDAYKEMAAKIQPLASAIPNVDQSTVLRGLKITDSEVGGYQKAEVGQSFMGTAGGLNRLAL